MIGKARNADGTRPGLPVASPAHLMELVTECRRNEPNWSVSSGRQRRDGWELVLTGHLRDACGLSYSEVAARVGVAPSCVGSRLRAHWRLTEESAEYGTRAAALLAESLAVFVEPQDPLAT